MSKIGQLSAIKHLRIAAQGPLYDNDNAHDLCARALLELADRLEALERGFASTASSGYLQLPDKSNFGQVAYLATTTPQEDKT